MTPATYVSTSVTVEAPRAHAFAVFTERFDTWWPRSHHNGPSELAEAVLEPRAGGRWYARDADGSVGEWGTVLVWDPPARLVLGWQLDTEFEYDPDLVTEVEVTFTELGPGRTLVALEHRNLDRFGTASAEMRDTFGSDNGWSGILGAFVRHAESASVDRGHSPASGVS